MPVALEQFVKQIADSGVIAPGKLENFVPPKAHPKDAQELARQLVQSKQLTKYQAQEIYQGRAKSLILGNYTIVDKIGAGGMGQVFKAEHRRMHRTVAIKMLPPAVTKDLAAVARFQREVEAAAKLRHTNIVAADDADEANGVHFLVMEYAEGSDLSALVKKNGPFPVAKAVNYILQAALGLEYAHKHGVIHRDIKPANLLLNFEGTVKVLDMGLARIESGGDAGTQAELTGTGAIMGTVDYMAPEQGLSTKHADARADIYSLGCTLHYLLTGNATYEGETVAAKLLAHHTRPIPELRKVRDEVPAELEAVFQKMVAKKVEDRYQSMSEVVAALQECAAATSAVGKPQAISETSSDNANLSFLAEATDHTQHHGQTKQAKQLKKEARPAKKTSGWNRKHRMIVGGAVGAGLLAAAILAAVVVRLQTKDGTLTVEVNQPDAVVQVLDAEGKVEISKLCEKGTILISVDPGKHRLNVEMQGFQFFTQDFEMESGGTQSIKATLEPLKKEALAAGQPNKPWNTPPFQQWMKTVAAMPAEKQVDAVSKKLQELNPGFDGNLRNLGWNGPPIVEHGVVTQLRLSPEHMRDLSPLRALTGLKVLACYGGRDLRGELADLSPLAGMQLTGLNVSHTQVSDLSPLEGLPLTELDFSATAIAELSPLAAMPLKTLMFRQTIVSDLSPLRGMSLEVLNCSQTRIADLSPLQGLGLKLLNCLDTKVTNLLPLGALKLTWLGFTPKNITQGIEVIRRMESLQTIHSDDSHGRPPAEFWKKYDAGEFGKPDSTNATPDHKPTATLDDLAFQKWMKEVAALPAEQQVEAVAKKLQELNPGFDGKLTGGNGKDTSMIRNGVVEEVKFFTDNVTDISPLRVFGRLKLLRCSPKFPNRSELSDLSPIEGMPLTLFECTFSKISDLSPLRGMPLTILSCESTPIADLFPLRGMPLGDFNCQITQVSDLSPLKGLPLTKLHCYKTRVSDLSLCRGMNLVEISIAPKNITKGMDVIRQMKSLKRVEIGWRDSDKFSVDEFWKRYDAGEFGKADAAHPAPDREPITTRDDPTFQQWMKAVAALPAEKQVEEVLKKLQDLNPGHAKWETHKINDGVVTELEITTDNTADISPVRALSGLTYLNCRSVSNQGDGRLSDLSPLAGMSLIRLNVDNTRVSDLSPLAGMPLAELWCEDTRVSDLSPLKGTPLTYLKCVTTQVLDLSPLQGMKLTTLLFTPMKITKGLDVIRQMKSLTFIGTSGENHWPPEEFWKKYDAGDFSK